MNIVGEIKETYKSIPEPVKSFLKRALLVFIIWKLIYHVFLFNGRIIDAPLTYITSYSTSLVLSWIYPHDIFRIKEDCTPLFTNKKVIACIDNIRMDGKKIVGISDYCNGLELFVLYIGFLFCIPSSFKKISLYILTGIVLIYILNILRCAGIALLSIHQNKLIDIAHHYVFKMIVYAIIFLIWMFYAKNQSADKSQ